MADDTAPSWCIDFAYVEQGCLFVFGWFVEPGPKFQGLLLHLNGRHVDLARNVVRVPRPDVAPQTTSARRAANDHGLVVAVEIGPELQAGETIDLWIVLPDGSVVQIAAESSGNQARFVHFARGNLLSLLHLLGAVPEIQRPKLAAIAERARAPVDSQAVIETETLQIGLICVPFPDTLVVVGRIADPRRHPAPVELLAGETRLRRRLRSLPAPDNAAVFIIVAELGGIPAPERYVVSQLQGNGHQRAIFPRDDVPRGLPALDGLLLPMDPDLQLTILEELGDALAARADGAEAGRSLRRLWTERVDRLPNLIERGATATTTTTRLVIDDAWQIGPHGVYLIGWLLCDREQIRSIAFRAPAQPPFELPSAWTADQRHDVWSTLRAQGLRLDTDALGFTCYVPISLGADTSGCTLCLTQRDGAMMRLRLDIAATPDDPLTLIKQILTSFPQTHRELRRLLDRHVGPAIAALWSARPGLRPDPSITRFGPRPAQPEVSLVVPIYGRADFIEFQLAQFANDADLRKQELIYVVDDPSLYDTIRVAAADLYACYAVAFTLVYGERNAGFAAATNLGAAQASGEFLLLLNSDVLPRIPGWLSRLVASHRRLDAGAVAPKLLYEDGSIQHAGMKFFPLPVWDGLWVNDHPLKGQPDTIGREPFACDTLTGACLLLRLDAYRALGGLSEDYIIGDFEDSDLCLQLRRSGKQNWLIPSVELYHLERQSQNMIGENDWRANLTLYNCWLHTHRWSDDIAAMMEQPA